MRKTYLLFSFSILLLKGFSQAPLSRQWDYSYGGYNSEFISQIMSTTDGGFICGGISMSNALFEKSADNWDITEFTYDWWLIKNDANGSKQWDITLGGNTNDFYYSAIQTSDGGYIVVGSTNSPVSGNVSTPGAGNADAWIVKLSSAGNILWEKRYGGDSVDAASAVLELQTGGYMVAGHTNSSQGLDVSDPSFGSFDYWLLRLDASGNKLWDKRYGGSSDESVSSILFAPADTYVIAGASVSPVSGVKTQPNYVNGLADIWFVKIDSSGNKISDVVKGSLADDYAIHAMNTSDGNFLVSCVNFANTGADKTENGYGVDDFWVLKMDPSFNILWDHSIGGFDNEGDGCTLTQLQDGGYLISGTSYSPPGYWKSETNNGPECTWTVKVDAAGNKVWDKTILTPYSHEEFGVAAQLNDGCIVIGNNGDGMIGIDKTDTSWNFDYWCIKYCDTTLASTTVAGFTAPADICPGTCVTFANTSINGNSFQWFFSGANPDSSNDINPANICYNTSGDYDVTLIAYGSSANDTLTMQGFIHVYPAPPPQGILQNGDTLFANAGAVSYQWYFNGSAVPGATNYFFIAPASGDYNVIATDVNGCEVEAVIFNVLASIQENYSSTGLIFPNPAYDKISFRTEFASENITIYNFTGEEILKMNVYKQPAPETYVIDISSLTPGIYFLEAKNERQTFRQRFIKE